jgi:hypothetical protein
VIEEVESFENDRGQDYRLPTPGSYTALVRRLNENSVRRVHNAYVDVAWDDPEMLVDPADPGWELSDDALDADPWYLAQDSTRKRAIGLHRTAESMKVGIEFENVLARGLLNFAATLPNCSPEFRYIYHEIAEETQHSLMFQEFVDRSGADVSAFPAEAEASHQAIIEAGREFPELLFMDALIGEDIIDHFQRRRIAQTSPPILRRIFEIHVNEEARHRSFARAWLGRRIPELSPRNRRRLAAYVPSLAIGLAERLLLPTPASLERIGAPADVIGRVRTGDRYRRLRAAALTKTKAFCRGTGLLTDELNPLWAPLA